MQLPISNNSRNLKDNPEFPIGDDVMRKVSLCFFSFFLSLSICAFAGSFKKPTRIPAETTPEQKAVIREGIALHDQGDYDGAIKKYESVLSSNPDNISALYEVSYSYFAKKDYRKALELSEKGTDYVSNVLPQFYMQVANCWDHLGEPEKAIDIYKKMLKDFPREPLLHYNLALTYSQNNKPELAISNLKEELYVTPDHPTSHLLLGGLFQKNGYAIPAIFALSRFMILESKSVRAANALAGLQQLINSGVVAKDEKNISITIDPKAKKDEGDFTSIQMALSLVSAGRFLEKNKDKSSLEKEVEQFRSFFQIMLEMVGDEKKKLRFTGEYYVPYFIEMQKNGHVDAFVYWIHGGSKDKEVDEWLEKNPEKVGAFLNWSKQYQWPQKKG